ncbi:MAG: cyclic nucleotide-binding domain-containing protein [Myxococcota bacterium]
MTLATDRQEGGELELDVRQEELDEHAAPEGPSQAPSKPATSGEASVVEALRPLFGTLSPPDLAGLAAGLERLSLECGQELFRQGDPSDSMYLVVRGRLEVRHEQRRRCPRVVAVGPQGLVGKLNGLRPEPRSATVTALEDTELARIDIATFGEWSALFPTFVLNVRRRVVDQHHRRETLIPQDSVKSLAVLSHPAGPDPMTWAEKLAEGLNGMKTVNLLPRSLVEARYSAAYATTSPCMSPLGRWLAEALAELELLYETLIYIPDRHSSSWSERCIRQADRVLVLAEATALETPGELEKLAASVAPVTPRELVLLHADTIETERAEAWSENGRFMRVHHLQAGNRRHTERLAAELIGVPKPRPNTSRSPMADLSAFDD